MKLPHFNLLRIMLVWFGGLTILSAAASPLQPVSLIDASQPSPAGASGDSWLPVISPDGRYVLFASSANNLVTNSNGNPIAALNLPKLNVYLRDRTNGTTTLVSVNVSGTGGGNGDSVPSQISTSGRYALFESIASNLVPGDTNGASDVFLRDMINGITFLVSANSTGGFGNGNSGSSAMTPDGRYVAFVSSATNLVANDTNRIVDVFVRDMLVGSTVLVSAGAISTNLSVPTGSSEAPDITPDGRFVAFFSTATNLVVGVTNAGEIYVRDLVSGTTTRASVHGRTMLGTPNAICYNHAVSADGNFVAYEVSTNQPAATVARGVILRYNMVSGLTDLVHTNANVPTTSAFEDIRSLTMTPDGRFIAFVANNNGISGTNTCIALWDGQSRTTSIASVNLNGQVPPGTCDWPVINPDGRYIAFLSSATGLVANALFGDYHLYVRDMLTATTALVAVDTNGTGSSISPSSIPALSDDGRFVAFESPDTSLVANDRNRDYDVFVRDLTINPIELISFHDPAMPSLTPNGPSIISSSAISADGSLVAFASEAEGLVSNDTNDFRDVFVRDRLHGTNILVSINTNGISGDSGSADSAISSDGRYVAFTSAADDLVAGDANKSQDVFVRDLQAASTTLVSVNMNGTGTGNNASYSPAVSANGRFVLFRSKASNLAAGSFTTGSENLFLRDLLLNNTYALTTAGVVYSAATPDGRYVAFVDSPGAAAGKIYLWDSLAGARVFTNSSSAIAGLGLSPNGNRIAYWTGTSRLSLDVTDWVSNSEWVVTTGFPASRLGLQFSSDGNFLTYAARLISTSTNEVFLYDLQTGANLLVSSPFASGHSDSPVISPDGRFVAYRSSATNVALGATSGVPQIFLYDRLSSSTTLVTSSRFGIGAGDNRGLAPIFSGNGEILLFESWASDLVGSDFNHNADLFSYTLLYLTVTPGPAGQGASLNWPVVPGNSYSVEYKNDLNDPVWHTLSSSVTFVGNRGHATDLSPAATSRFYRVVTFSLPDLSDNRTRNRVALLNQQPNVAPEPPRVSDPRDL